jgi:hypothetical protein
MNHLFSLGHIDEQARRLCLPVYVDHLLSCRVSHAVEPDRICEVRVRQGNSRTLQALPIAQDEPPLSILDDVSS